MSYEYTEHNFKYKYYDQPQKQTDAIPEWQHGMMRV